jgi:hypothetical protein
LRDAFDGFTSLAIMNRGVRDIPRFSGRLQTNLELFESLCDGGENLITADLGTIGDWFRFAARLAGIMQSVSRASGVLADEFEQLLRAAQKSMRIVILENSEAGKYMKAEYRVPHKELELILGYNMIRKLKPSLDSLLKSFVGKQRKSRIKEIFEELDQFSSYISELQEFWMDDSNHNGPSWLETQSFNFVILAQIALYL